MERAGNDDEQAFEIHVELAGGAARVVPAMAPGDVRRAVESVLRAEGLLATAAGAAVDVSAGPCRPSQPGPRPPAPPAPSAS